MQSIKSITKKIDTIRKGGIDSIKAIQQGVHNYNNFDLSVEMLAEERAKVCVNCDKFVEEPNKLLQVNDDLIFELDLMMCNDCGCELPYKTRQSIIKCAKWTR